MLSSLRTWPTLLAAITFSALAGSIFATVHVNGYTRSNGTYVPAHNRSSPNSTKADNWSSQGNVNPYTGKAGTKRVDSAGSSSEVQSSGDGYYSGGAADTNYFQRDTDPDLVLAKSADETSGKATPERFAQLRIGNTPSEVYALLGRPSGRDSSVWTYDGVGWLEFSASDRVTRIRPTASLPQTTAESAPANSVTTGDSFLYSDAPARAGYPNSWTILENIGYVSAYDETFRNPAWVAYHLHGATPEAPDRPETKYPMDPRTGSKVNADDYPPGYDHGHMAPNYSISAFFGEAAQAETFFMSNMLPQRPRLNRGPWKSVETAEYKTWAKEGGDLWIICGPVYTTKTGAAVNPTNRYGAKKVCVPVACFKIVIRRDGVTLRTLAFIMPQELRTGQKPAEFLTSVREVEKRTGLNFFSSLPQSKQDEIETTIAKALWP